MNRLRELAQEFNMSTYDFEEALGYSRNTISYIYREKAKMDEDKIIAFCNYFQVSMEYFLCQTNNGIYVDVLGTTCSLTKEKFLLYKSMNKIEYFNKKRTLVINSLDEVKFVNSKVPNVELINEI